MHVHAAVPKFLQLFLLVSRKVPQVRLQWVGYYISDYPAATRLIRCPRPALVAPAIVLHRINRASSRQLMACDVKLKGTIPRHLMNCHQ